MEHNYFTRIKMIKASTSINAIQAGIDIVAPPGTEAIMGIRHNRSKAKKLKTVMSKDKKSGLIHIKPSLERDVISRLGSRIEKPTIVMDVNSGVGDKIITILEKDSSKYLSIENLSAKTQIPNYVIVDAINANRDKIRLSLAKDATGSALYASKRRVSTISDVWTAFKAVNESKYGA